MLFSRIPECGRFDLQGFQGRTGYTAVPWRVHEPYEHSSVLHTDGQPCTWGYLVRASFDQRDQFPTVDYPGWKNYLLTSDVKSKGHRLDQAVPLLFDDQRRETILYCGRYDRKASVGR